MPVACQSMIANCGANTDTSTKHLHIAYNAY